MNAHCSNQGFECKDHTFRLTISQLVATPLFILHSSLTMNEAAKKYCRVEYQGKTTAKSSLIWYWRFRPHLKGQNTGDTEEVALPKLWFRTPYYAKFAIPGDATYFRHIDMNIPKYPSSTIPC